MAKKLDMWREVIVARRLANERSVMARDIVSAVVSLEDRLANVEALLAEVADLRRRLDAIEERHFEEHWDAQERAE